MPEIKLQHIVSYSSQDTNNPAENLLKPDGVHKWKSASAGEKSLSAILQFEKASRIHAIDIGNDGSAFVEVLVARSSSHSEDFKVILVTSSFMSPMESRNNTNRYSVRMFGSEKLSKTSSEEKWDRVKIICTQPFNKTTNYGLSFIKFHSPPSSENQSSATVSTVDKEVDNSTDSKKIGAFFFHRDENDKKDLKAGSLFARQKDKPESSPLTGAAAIRAASNQARSTYHETKSSTSANSTPEAKKKRKHNVSDDEDASEVKKSKSKNGDSHRSHDRPTHQKEDSRKEKHTDTIKKEKKSNSSSRDDVKSTSSSSSNSGSHKNSHHRSETSTSKAAVSKSNKPFSKTLSNVVFVLSGFQNPFRADLRDKAKEMGAKYRPDWSSDCTHLVCAFANTPKYNMVKGRGRIVTKQWVLDCYRQRTLLPWRTYQLQEEEEEEDKKEDKGQVKDEAKKQKKEEVEEDEEDDDDDDDDDEEEQQTQVMDEEKEDYSQPSSLSKSKSDPEYLPSMEDRESTDEEEGVVSEEDTDDEVRRIKDAANVRSESSGSSDAGPSTSDVPAADTLEINSNVDSDDDDNADNNDHDNKNNRDDDDDDDDDDDNAFGAATDVDEDNSDDDSELPVLPDFFSNKHFFLYGKFSESERHELTRYIIAYNGEVEDYMTDKVNYVVTSEQWDDNFDEALSNYPQLTFVHPKWLYSCHMKNKCVPYQLHIVTPTSE